MDQPKSNATGPGEQNLTPGEQRILTLMEQGQQRMDQRMERMDLRMERMDLRMRSLEEGQQLMVQRMESVELKLSVQGEQLQTLTTKVSHEAAASRLRDRQLAMDIESVREERQERERGILARIDQAKHEVLAALDMQLTTLRIALSERLTQHNTRLEMLEQAEHIRENAQGIPRP